MIVLLTPRGVAPRISSTMGKVWSGLRATGSYLSIAERIVVVKFFKVATPCQAETMDRSEVVYGELCRHNRCCDDMFLAKDTRDILATRI